MILLTFLLINRTDNFFFNLLNSQDCMAAASLCCKAFPNSMDWYNGQSLSYKFLLEFVNVRIRQVITVSMDWATGVLQ